MIVTVLGSGTSHGVPMIGCACGVCQSNDPRDARSRPSILIELDARGDAPPFRLLVDTGPDLRRQALRIGLDRLDAVFYTHHHADHVFGFDELRRFNHLTRRPLPAYGSASTMDALVRTFAYAFDPEAPRGGGVPDIRLFDVAGPFGMGGHDVIPVPVLHGRTPVYGLRIGSFAYLTDCNQIPRTSMALLRGVEVLLIDALRHKPHPTHFTVAEAIEASSAIGARQTYLTHIAHDLPHADTCAALPPGVSLAYDGLVIACK